MIDTPPEYDVGPPYVSPREPGDPGQVPPPLQDLDAAKEIVEALTVREYVNKGIWPTWYMEKHGLPATFDDLPTWLQKAIKDGYDSEYRESVSRELRPFHRSPLSATVLGLTPAHYPKLAARLVRMDHWTDLCTYIENHLHEQGYNLKPAASDVTPPDIPFIERIRCTSETHTRIAQRFEDCFQAKYHYKQPRPVSRIHKLVDADLAHLPEFHDTLQEYPHPKHYSHPAGHGTAAGATYRSIKQRWDIPEQETKSIRQGCRCFGHFRTFSLMHTASENEEGFKLGSDVPQLTKF